MHTRGIAELHRLVGAEVRASALKGKGVGADSLVSLVREKGFRFTDSAAYPHAVRDSGTVSPFWPAAVRRPGHGTSDGS